MSSMSQLFFFARLAAGVLLLVLGRLFAAGFVLARFNISMLLPELLTRALASEGGPGPTMIRYRTATGSLA